MRKSSRGNPYHDERGRFASANAHKLKVVNSDKYYEERTATRSEELEEKKRVSRVLEHIEISRTKEFVAYTDGERIVYGDGTSIDFSDAQDYGFTTYEEYKPEHISKGTHFIFGDNTYAVGCEEDAEVTLTEDGHIYTADGIGDREDCEHIGTFRKEIEFAGYYYYGDVINVYQKGNDVYIDSISKENLRDKADIEINTEGDWEAVEHIYNRKEDVNKYYEPQKRRFVSTKKNK